MMRTFCDCCKKEEKEQFYDIFFDIPTGKILTNQITGQTKEEIIRKQFMLCRMCFAGIYSMFDKDRVNFPKAKSKLEINESTTR